MFDFSDLSDDQVNEYKNPNFLVEEGRCNFIVLEAKLHITQTGKNAGNKSIMLVVEITDSKGKKAKVFDYLTVGDKLVRFLNFFGFENELKNKKIDPEKLKGVKGVLQNKHRDNSLTGDKDNSIHYYINPNAPSKKEENVSRRTSAPDFVDDDIPF